MPGGDARNTGVFKAGPIERLALVEAPFMPSDDFLMKAERTPSGPGVQVEGALSALCLICKYMQSAAAGGSHHTLNVVFPENPEFVRPGVRLSGSRVARRALWPVVGPAIFPAFIASSANVARGLEPSRRAGSCPRRSSSRW